MFISTLVAFIHQHNRILGLSNAHAACCQIANWEPVLVMTMEHQINGWSTQTYEFPWCPWKFLLVPKEQVGTWVCRVNHYVRVATKHITKVPIHSCSISKHITNTTNTTPKNRNNVATKGVERFTIDPNTTVAIVQSIQHQSLISQNTILHTTKKTFYQRVWNQPQSIQIQPTQTTSTNQKHVPLTNIRILINAAHMTCDTINRIDQDAMATIHPSTHASPKRALCKVRFFGQPREIRTFSSWYKVHDNDTNSSIRNSTGQQHDIC